jgi:DNA-binding NtrC family response regulator
MDSYRSDEEHGHTRSAGDNARIVIVDHRPTEAGVEVEIDEVMARCRVTPRRVCPGCKLERRADDCEIALVAFAEQPTLHAPVLEDVRRLKAGGFTVLCYAEGSAAWPLGVQCRLLLAGASDLFDSGAPTFAGGLRERLDVLLQAARAREIENARLTQQMLRLGVIGSSPPIIAAFRSIMRVSTVSDLPVLITGETGTGKEVAARAIHQLDPHRRDRPFVAVNCGAITPGLAESELFGHRRGAFTGAERERAGLIRAAHGGVLFLDEIGDLELALQAKLLRVLQERRVMVVGDEREVPIDVRVVAATNRDLEEMIGRHAFRADLFHRLNVLAIRVPALRDRPQDIEALVQHFVSQCGGEEPRPLSASREFVDALRQLDLPGNVRQLENVVRRAVVSARDANQLGLKNLPPELWLELSRAAGAPTSDAASGGSASEETRRDDRAVPLNPVAILDATAWKLEDALELCEQHLVAAALGASRGNRSRAARLLGISPRCIFNKMRKHRLSA